MIAHVRPGSLDGFMYGDGFAAGYGCGAGDVFWRPSGDGCGEGDGYGDGNGDGFCGGYSGRFATGDGSGCPALNMRWEEGDGFENSTHDGDGRDHIDHARSENYELATINIQRLAIATCSARESTVALAVADTLLLAVEDTIWNVWEAANASTKHGEP